MTSIARELRPIEEEALLWLSKEGGYVLVTRVPDSTENGILGDRTPGRATFRRLEKASLCFLTEEEPLFPEDGPEGETWTPSYGLTKEGETWVAQRKLRPAPASPSRPRPR